MCVSRNHNRFILQVLWCAPVPALSLVMSARRGASARKKRKASARSQSASDASAPAFTAKRRAAAAETRKGAKARPASSRRAKHGGASAARRPSASTRIDTSVRFSERDLVWVQSDISGACVAKIRRVPESAGGVYRVNYYGTRSYDLVHDGRLQLFRVGAVPTILDQKCDGDPEAYRSVYYALESLHRRKMLSVSDLPSRTWSVLNRYLNEEESSSSDSGEETSSSEEEDNKKTHECHTVQNKDTRVLWRSQQYATTTQRIGNGEPSPRRQHFAVIVVLSVRQRKEQQPGV